MKRADCRAGVRGGLAFFAMGYFGLNPQVIGENLPEARQVSETYWVWVAGGIRTHVVGFLIRAFT